MSMFTYNFRGRRIARRLIKITFTDASDFLSVVDDLCPGLDKSVENDVAIKVDYRDACQSITFLREDSLTIKCQNLCLATNTNNQ